MMRSAGRQHVVEPEADLVGCLPAEPQRWKRFALQRIEDRKIPGEEKNRELRSLFNHSDQKLAQRERPAVIGGAVFSSQFGAAVEIPTDDKDAMACLPQRITQGREIRSRINQNGGAGCL